MAVDLTSRGFAVNLYEMPEFAAGMREVFQTHTIHSTGMINGSFALNKVTSDIGEALDGVRYILVVTPAFAHDAYTELLRGKVTADQVIVVYPGAFAGLLFRTVFGDVDCPMIAEVNNLPYDTRLEAPGRVVIHGYNPVNIAFLPAEEGAALIDDMRAIHPYEKVYADVLEAGLSLVNPGVHAGPSLLSVTAIENSAKRPSFLYEHGVTPSSCRINIQVDNERKAIGRRLGYRLTPIEDFTGLGEGYTWQELYMSIHGNISLTPISGPHAVTSRYFTEDAPVRPGAVEQPRPSGRRRDAGHRLDRQHLQRRERTRLVGGRPDTGRPRTGRTVPGGDQILRTDRQAHAARTLTSHALTGGFRRRGQPRQSFSLTRLSREADQRGL